MSSAFYPSVQTVDRRRFLRGIAVTSFIPAAATTAPSREPDGVISRLVAAVRAKEALMDALWRELEEAEAKLQASLEADPIPLPNSARCLVLGKRGVLAYQRSGGRECLTVEESAMLDAADVELAARSERFGLPAIAAHRKLAIEAYKDAVLRLCAVQPRTLAEPSVRMTYLSADDRWESISERAKRALFASFCQTMETRT